MGNICKHYCEDFSIVKTGGDMSVRKLLYSQLNTKYCRRCEVHITQAQWQAFPSPVRCKCCGLLLRVRPKVRRLGSKERFRYD